MFLSTPSKLSTVLCTKGRLAEFPAPQAVASVTPPWGLRREFVGDGDAAAAPSQQGPPYPLGADERRRNPPKSNHGKARVSAGFHALTF